MNPAIGGAAQLRGAASRRALVVLRDRVEDHDSRARLAPAVGLAALLDGALSVALGWIRDRDRPRGAYEEAAFVLCSRDSCCCCRCCLFRKSREHDKRQARQAQESADGRSERDGRLQTYILFSVARYHILDNVHNISPFRQK